MAKIKTRVHYVSPKGCAEAVAEAIAREAGAVKEALPPAYLPEGIALMFLGCEGVKADKITMEFLKAMNSKRVAVAALFNCNLKGSDAALAQVREALVACGVKVLDKTFISNSGKGFFSGKMPTADELKAAAEWAKACIAEVAGE